MAYPHDKQEVVFTTTAGSNVFSATTSGDKGYHPVLFVPHVVRACAVTPVNSGAVTSTLQVLFKHLSLASGSTASTIATINGIASDQSGDVIYKSGLNVTLQPGERVVLNVSQIVSGTSNFSAVVYMEPKWEQPTNDASMRVTT